MKRKKRQTKKKKTSLFVFPQHVLRPVQQFLTAELKKLTLRKKEVEKADPFSDPSRVNDNASDDTEAAEQFGHARAEAVKKHIERRIIQIRKALTRIKLGRYGICEECGQFIDTERLRVFPETTLCIRCMKKKEKQRRK